MRTRFGMALLVGALAACSNNDNKAPTGPAGPGPSADEAPAGQQLVATFTLDIDPAGDAKVTMVDHRLATSVSVGATANKVNLITLGKGPCGPGLNCTNMRLQSLFAANDLRGTTVVLSKLANSPGASVANGDPLPSHLVGTTAVAGIGVWLFGNLEEAGAAGDAIDRTWEFNWTSGSISVAGKVFADVRAAGASMEVACTDGADNDGDSVLDCNDGDCATSGACPAEVCDTKNRDEDSNGLTDCADPACSGHPRCTEYDCDDGDDNDSDGSIDCQDGDCNGQPNCVESVCDDSIDNDGDGNTDCNDGDCNGSPGCAPPSPEDCNNYVDDNGNGQVDCADSTCSGDFRCASSCSGSCGSQSSGGCYCDELCATTYDDCCYDKVPQCGGASPP